MTVAVLNARIGTPVVFIASSDALGPHGIRASAFLVSIPPRVRSIALLFVALLVLAPTHGAAQRPAAGVPADSFDILISGGRVYDGTGNPAFHADVGIRDGRVVAIGRLAGSKAARTVNATGKFVTPGFIDIHSHADDGARASGGFRDPDPRRRAAPNLVAQGQRI
jgi:N-acyl-D-amino-acid deacylase